jgi:hypothetical protein
VVNRLALNVGDTVCTPHLQRQLETIQRTQLKKCPQ